MAVNNTNLHKAKQAKNDEFYTQLSDVAEELRHYKKHFKDKTVYCNCDDDTSAFWKYFHLNFKELGLKKLISTHYDKEKPTYKMEYEGGDDNDTEVGVKTPLQGNGDFRNEECIELLKEADICVTNPPFSCYSSDTEVLTSNGWKLFKDVDITKDLIMSLNPETKQAEMVKAVDYLCNPYKGKMYHFHNKNMDFMVTPNHKMYSYHTIVYNVTEQRKSLETVLVSEPLREAEKIRKSCLLPIQGFSWKGNEEEYFYLPSVEQLEQCSRRKIIIPEKKIKMEDWLEFFGFYLADGCYRDHINTLGKRDYTVSIAQNEGNEEYVLDLFKRIGFTCNIGIKNGKEKRNSVCKNYNIYSKQLWTYLEQFGRSQDKYIPDEFMNLDTKYLVALLKGYTNGDCGKCADGSVHYSSTSKRLIDNVQQLILKIYGIMTQVHGTNRKHSYDDNYSFCWHINVNLNRYHMNFSKYGTPDLVGYCDNVYCLTLERNHIMLVRHNGIIGWCGNCFREYLAQLVDYNKGFIIWGNNNAITYKEVFPLLKENKIWLGYLANKTCYFRIPDEYEKWDKQYTDKMNDGHHYGKVPAISVFTNLDIPKRHEKLILWKEFNEEDYPRYDNYLAWNVDKVSEIPKDDFFEITVSEEEYKQFKETYGDDCELIEVIQDEVQG